MTNETALIIDTAQPELYVILARGGKVLSAKKAGGSHSRVLNSCVGEALAESGVGFSDVGVFACNVGTGSFTGIRIGVAAVKAYLLAFPKAKAVTVTTLELLAARKKAGHYLMEAGRDLFYYAKADGESLTPAVLVEKENAGRIMERGNFALYESGGDFTDALAECVFKKIRAGDFAEEIEPVYIRKPQAQEEYEKRLITDIGRDEKDIAGMVAVEKLCFGAEAWDENCYNTDSKNTVTKGIYDGGRLAAYAMLGIAADEADLMTIAVLPDFRGRGYGLALAQALIAEAGARGVKRVALEVSKGNRPAIELYRKLGFAAAGERKNYYPAGAFGSRDALIMTLEII